MRIQIVALVDPTLAYHERLYLYSGNEVVDWLAYRPAGLVASGTQTRGTSGLSDPLP
jgi:hypothetical protein